MRSIEGHDLNHCIEDGWHRVLHMDERHCGARRGYRFIGAVDQGAGRPEPAVAPTDSDGGSSASRRAAPRTRVWLAGIPIVLIATAAGWGVWSPGTSHEFGVTAKATMLTGAS